MTRLRTLEHIADVRRRPGVQRPITRAFPVEHLGPLGTSSATVPPEGEIVLDGTIEASGLDIVLTGTATAPWEGECRRCLRAVTGLIQADLQEIFTPHPVEGETWPVEADSIDLGPVLHDAVLLSLPLVPLCAVDCPGPAPDRFPALVEGDPALAADPDDEESAPAAPPADPRWAALDDLRFD
ncbi:MAG TPA: YceD family protein [Iamia sp.]|nr:YceD family protein [Iamia sp.]